MRFALAVCSLGFALLISACQTAPSPKLKPEEQRALNSFLYGATPKDRDADQAIAGDEAALHRVFTRASNARLDSDAVETQCYHLLRVLFSLFDHKFAEALRKEAPAVRDRIVLLIRDSFRQLGYPGRFPETEAVAPDVPVYRAGPGRESRETQ